jgi:hypothetical protein
MANYKNKIIGFDLDGVILDHTVNKLRLAKKFGWELKPEQTQSEIIKRIIPEPTYDQFQRILYDDPKISLLSPLMRGAKSTLAELKNKCPYFLISRRKKPQWAISILKFKGLWPKFFNENNAFFVMKPGDKNEIGRKLGITHYIDDELGVLEKLVDIENKILFDAHDLFPHIAHFGRIKSWKEFADFIND